MRILVLDDASLEREILARFAARAGHAVVAEATDLAEAFARLEEALPDVAVVDGRLPPEGGPAAIAALRARLPHTPLLVIAALEETALVRAAFTAGANGILQRPLLPSQVGDVLARVARTQPPESE